MIPVEEIPHSQTLVLTANATHPSNATIPYVIETFSPNVICVEGFNPELLYENGKYSNGFSPTRFLKKGTKNALHAELIKGINGSPIKLYGAGLPKDELNGLLKCYDISKDRILSVTDDVGEESSLRLNGMLPKHRIKKICEKYKNGNQEITQDMIDSDSDLATLARGYNMSQASYNRLGVATNYLIGLRERTRSNPFEFNSIFDVTAELEALLILGGFDIPSVSELRDDVSAINDERAIATAHTFNRLEGRKILICSPTSINSPLPTLLNDVPHIHLPSYEDDVTRILS